MELVFTKVHFVCFTQKSAKETQLWCCICMYIPTQCNKHAEDDHTYIQQCTKGQRDWQFGGVFTQLWPSFCHNSSFPSLAACCRTTLHTEAKMHCLRTRHNESWHKITCDTSVQACGEDLVFVLRRDSPLRSTNGGSSSNSTCFFYGLNCQVKIQRPRRKLVGGRGFKIASLCKRRKSAFGCMDQRGGNANICWVVGREGRRRRGKWRGERDGFSGEFE